MSRIAVNTRTLAHPVTGVQRYVLELLARMGPRLDRLQPPVPRLGVRGHWWEQRTLPKLLDGRLLWSPSNTGPLGVSHQVVTLHDVVPLDHPEWLSRRFALWYRALIPRLARRVKAILAVSEFTKQRIIETCAVDPAKIHVVHHGVDPRFSPQPTDRVAAVRRRLAVPDGPYVLTVGTLEPRKNLRRLLAAWRQVTSTHADAALVIAGGAGVSRIFRQLDVAQPPRVLLTDRVDDDDLPALYSGADVFAYVSEYEGFGLPPLEAMACGTPVVTANRTAMPEVVGDAAVTVDPFDVDAIAAGLSELMADADRRADLSARGCARSRAFTWESAAAKTWDVLEAAARDKLCAD